MPSYLNPDKIVKLGDYSFYFGNRALRTFENESGITVGAAFSGKDSISFTHLTYLVKAGLAQFHPLSLEDVDLIIDEFGLEDTMNKAMEAVAKSLPSKDSEIVTSEVAAPENLQEAATMSDGFVH